FEAKDPACGIRMTHEIERPIHASVARAKNLLPWKISNCIPAGVSVANGKDLDALAAVINQVLVVEGYVGLLEYILLEVVASLRPRGCLFPLLGTIDREQAARWPAGNDLGTFLGPDAVSVGMISVMVRVENVPDGFLRRFLDVRNHVAGFLGKVRIHHEDIILENDPDVIASAKGNIGIGRGYGGIAEEDA